MAAVEELFEEARRRRRLPEPADRRRLRGSLSQERIASAVSELAGRPITRSTISRWETGRRAPKGPLLEAYLSILDQLAMEGRRG
jgi:transcriptional regulator with XRE-family HTH domain